MGEEGSISHSCSESTQTVHEEHMFKQESDAVCTVILESEDVTFIPILPVEAGEEVVLYEDMQDVKVEIDVCSDGYQNIYSEGYAQQSIGSLVSNPRSKSSRQGLHKCKTCGKTFTQVPNLVTHERIHTGEKPFKCSVCMKPFSQQPNLWKHMRIHTGERPYQCGTCKKCFTQQANLTKHTRIHTGERPYACQYCGKCFTQQANLTKHVRLHTGERPFHCRFCTKSFVQQSNLERHERTHTGVKPFKCKLCCDSFAQNAHLAKHVRSIHKMVKPIQSVYQIKEELIPVNSTVQSKQITSGDKFDNSKKYGIPVLICTKTGRIIKRLD